VETFHSVVISIEGEEDKDSLLFCYTARRGGCAYASCIYPVMEISRSGCPVVSISVIPTLFIRDDVLDIGSYQKDILLFSILRNERSTTSYKE
jgi:hypothetical protein